MSTSGRRTQAMRWFRSVGLLVCLCSVVPGQSLDVLGHQKISDVLGGFAGILQDGDHFGRALANLGDVDGDGVADLAVSAVFDDDGGMDRGAVWILFMTPEGQVRDLTKISQTSGGFTGLLADGDQLGTSLAPLGDLDGDGIPDLAAGAVFDDGGAPDSGALWIMFLRADGSVKGQRRIGHAAGGFAGLLDESDHFGSSLACVGDLDGNGTAELLVGAELDDDGGQDSGALWMLFLRTDGSVESQAKISLTSGGFTGLLSSNDWFGCALAPLGDLNGDGVPDVAVGAMMDDDGGFNRGAVWIVFLKADGSVLSTRKVSHGDLAFSTGLSNDDRFGRSITRVDDLNGDGIHDLIVGAHHDDDSGLDRGALWVLYLDNSGGVSAVRKVSGLFGGFTGTLKDGDNLGNSLAYLGDLSGDGVPEVAVGSWTDDDGGLSHGAVWTLSLGNVLSPWDNQGNGLGGSWGVPQLTASGSLQPGAATEVLMVGGPPLRPAVLAVGWSEFIKPLKGGVLVPFPDVLALNLATDATGSLAAAESWPLLVPAGFRTYIQVWISDLGMESGWVASNGLLATAP